MVKKNKLPRSKLARYSGTSPEKFVSLLPSSVQQAVRFSASRNKQQTSWYHWCGNVLPRHLEAIKALEAGYHVLIEKPIAFTEKEALSIVNVSQKTHKNAFAVLQVRHNKMVKIIQLAIKNNLLGKIRSISLVQRWQRPLNFFNSWRGSLEMAGGILYEMSIHYLDIIQWIFGMPEILSASGFNLKYKQLPYHDTVFSILRFPCGASGSLEVTVATEPFNLECSINVIGEKGAIKISGPILNKIEGLDKISGV